MAAGANTDVESLRTEQRNVAKFFEETRRFSRAAGLSFDEFEEEVAEYRQELERKIEEAGGSTGSRIPEGMSSDLALMLYEDEYADKQGVRELEAKLEELRKREQAYLSSRDVFIGNMRTLLQGCSDDGVVARGLPTLIRLLDEYLQQ